MIFVKVDDGQVTDEEFFIFFVSIRVFASSNIRIVTKFATDNVTNSDIIFILYYFLGRNYEL